MRILLVLLFLTSCSSHKQTDSVDSLGFNVECKTIMVRNYCKYTTHKNKITYCSDGYSTVPCEFYEDLK